MIELLVVIAIIGILASVVLASLNKARKQGRDARRVSDIKQLQLALELYFDSGRRYPDTLQGLVANGAISSIPKDPLSPQPTVLCRISGYCYAVRTDTGNLGLSYHIGANLELADAPALSSKKACNSTVSGSCMPAPAAYTCDPAGCTGTGFDGTATNPTVYDAIP